MSSRISLINFSYICFSFYFSTLFSFRDFFKVSLWDTVSELQIPNMLHTLKQIFVRILQVPWQIIFFICNCTFATHQSSSYLFSTNVGSVYITFWVDRSLYALWKMSETFYLALLSRQLFIVTLQHHILILLQPSCFSLLLSFSLNLDIKNNLIFLVYFLANSAFISFYFILSYSIMWKYLYPSSTIDFHLIDSNFCY